MKAVIDADQLVYATGFAANAEPLSHALHLVNKAMDTQLDEMGVDDYQVYISGKGNFREDVAITQGYKANRTAPKPTYYAEIREFLQSNWGAEVVDGMETDDKVSILLYTDFVANGGDPDKCQVILSSPDKDLNNTPGWHYNPQKKTKTFITDVQATRHFWWQMLCGDRTDNIPGLPYCTSELMDRYNLPKASAKGCGAGSASKILRCTKGIEEARDAVYDAYASWGVKENKSDAEIFDYLYEQAELLWMVRELDALGDRVPPPIDQHEFEKVAYHGISFGSKRISKHSDGL